MVYGQPGEGRGGGRGEGRGRGPRHEVMEQLTEDQREELHQMVTEMREAGATREEIHTAARALLEGWGIDLPEPRGDGEGHGPRFMEQLTEDQREEIRQMVTEMREAGATREEIHAAVHAKLEGWGIEIPDHPGRGHRRQVMEQLTEEQREELHQMVMEMREADATREEIHAAVREKLQAWGIELPEGCESQGAPGQSLIAPAEDESAQWGEIKKEFR